MKIAHAPILLAAILGAGVQPAGAQTLPPQPAKLTMAVAAGGETKGLKAILPPWEKAKGVKIELQEWFAVEAILGTHVNAALA